MPNHKAMLYLLVSAGTLVATVAVTPPTRTLAVTRVSVVDVIDGRIVPNSIVTIRGETISSVSQNSDLPADAEVVDGEGKFLIPGLWDMHAHIQGNEKAWLPLYIANGVAGIRDMGRTSTSSSISEMPRPRAARSGLGSWRQDRSSTMRPGDWLLRIRVRNLVAR